MSDFNIGKALAVSASASADVAFNLRFSQLQNTFINRLNDQINEVTIDPAKQRKIDQMVKENGILGKQRQALSKYVFDNQSNLGKAIDLTEQVAELRAAFQSDSDQENISAEEAAAFNEKKGEIVEKLRYMTELYHPDIYDSNPIQPLINLADELEQLEASEGVIDDEGTEPATNDNRAISDLFDQLDTKLDLAVTVTTDVVNMTDDLITSIDIKMAGLTASFTELNTVEQDRQLEEIEALKVKTGRILQAISIGYELQKQFTDDLASRLSDPVIEEGSVLNMFV